MPKPKLRQGTTEQQPKAKGWQKRMNERYRELMARGKITHLPHTVNRRQEKLYGEERKREQGTK